MVIQGNPALRLQNKKRVVNLNVQMKLENVSLEVSWGYSAFVKRRDYKLKARKV